MSLNGPPSHSGPLSYDSGYINQRIPEELHYSRVPFKDVEQVTNNFAEENIIERGYGWIVYKGELSGKKLAFLYVNEGEGYVTLSSLPEHQNIVPFIGCCDEFDELYFVFEYQCCGALDKYMTGAHLTWLMRVKICLDIASGLHYLQNHLQTHKIKIEDLNSASIHLDENWQAKIQLITPSALIYQATAPSLSATRRQVTSIAYEGQLDDVDISVVDEGQLDDVDISVVDEGQLDDDKMYTYVQFVKQCMFLTPKVVNH
ncbi:phloem protein 2-like protein [Tanacetum coccineum]